MFLAFLENFFNVFCILKIFRSQYHQEFREA